MEKESFGKFITKRRLQKGITLRGMAELINLSPGYYSDIEKGRRNPPDREALDKIIDILHLSEEECELMFDLVGKDRDEVSPDLPEYIMENEFVRTALRMAKDTATKEDWQQFTEILEKRKKGYGD